MEISVLESKVRILIHAVQLYCAELSQIFFLWQTTFRGFIWKWDAQSFGWAQEDNLNGAVPLCCFFTSFLGNIHSNSEYTMKKK